MCGKNGEGQSTFFSIPLNCFISKAQTLIYQNVIFKNAIFPSFYRTLKA